MGTFSSTLATIMRTTLLLTIYICIVVSLLGMSQANSNYPSAQNQETFAGLPSLRQYRIPDFRSRRSYHEINPRAFLNAEKLATGILSDVKTALQDFDRNGENQAFWGLVENALKTTGLEKPADPSRLLRLS